MTLGPRVRKAALTTHVTASVGWVGSVAAFLALAIAGTASDDEGTADAMYLAMDVIAWSVVLPLAFASFVTGLVQSFSSKWGLLRHYWVAAKLILTIVATVVLLLTLGDISALADRARDGTLAATGHHESQSSMVLHSAGGLVVLLLTTILAVFKPRGLTRRGWRKQQELRNAPA